MAYPKLHFFRAAAAVLALSFLMAGCKVTTLPSENKPDTSDHLRQVDLDIAGVGLDRSSTALDESLIEQFEKESGVRVIVKKTAAAQNRAEYLAYLALLVNSDGLPDLLLFPEFAPVVQKDLLYKLDSFLKDTAIPEPFLRTVSAEGSIYALPTHYALEGYFVNHALFGQNKLAVPTFGLSFTGFYSSIKGMAEKKTVLPISGLYEIPYWYPYVKGAEHWMGWQNGIFPLKDSSFIEGVSYAAQLRKACEGLRSASPAADWKKGRLAFYYGSTADSAAFENLPFAFSYIGLPGGKALVNPSYVGITKGSSHKEEAFALAKWLSVDQAGIQRRLKAEQADFFPLIPITEDALRKQFFTLHPLEGLEKVYDSWDRAVVAGADIIPSYRETVQEKKFLLPYDSSSHTLEEILRDAVDGKFSYQKEAGRLYNLLYPDQVQESAAQKKPQR